jgi:hypothetical protein
MICVYVLYISEQLSTVSTVSIKKPKAETKAKTKPHVCNYITMFRL